MADEKLTAQTEDTSPDGPDIVYVVIDPTGSPLGRKTTLANLLTGVAAKIGSIELGHATDTTLTRVSAGLVAVEGANLATQAYADAASDGWVSVSDSWSYASASTITVPSDATTEYQTGFKIRFKQGGAYKYYVCRTIAATLITVIVSTDYTVANAAITDIAYSTSLVPFGFPAKFDYTPAITYTGGSSDPTSFTLATSYWRMLGGDFFVTISGALDVGGGDRTNIVFTVPVDVPAISVLPAMDSITAAGLSSVGITGAVYAFTDEKIYYQRTMAQDGSLYINGSFAL